MLIEVRKIRVAQSFNVTAALMLLVVVAGTAPVGDTLVVDTTGFRDDLWIDWDGSVITEAAKVRERIRRQDFGHLEIEVTVDDPKAYTKPWTVTLRQQFAADAELIDEICAENEKSSQHLK